MTDTQQATHTSTEPAAAVVHVLGDGQAIDMPVHIAQDDELLRAALDTWMHGMEGAQFDRRVRDDGVLDVTVRKQTGRKGSDADDIDAADAHQLPPMRDPYTRFAQNLAGAPQRLNPALDFAWRLQHVAAQRPLDIHALLTLDSAREHAEARGEEELRATALTHQGLSAHGVLRPARRIPWGF